MIYQIQYFLRYNTIRYIDIENDKSIFSIYRVVTSCHGSKKYAEQKIAVFHQSAVNSDKILTESCTFQTEKITRAKIFNLAPEFPQNQSF